MRDEQHKTLGEDGNHEQRNADDQGSVPRGLELSTILQVSPALCRFCLNPIDWLRPSIVDDQEHQERQERYAVNPALSCPAK